MNQKIALIIAILLSIHFALAISSSEALSFIQQESHFLKENESVEIFPDAFVSLQGKDYFVATIVSNDAVKGFIAVEKEKKSIVSQNALNRELFRAGFISRSIAEYKDDLGKRGINWFFSSSNATFAGSLSRFLSDEKFELATIRNEMTGSALSTIDSMNGLLEEMSSQADELKNSLNEAVEFESSFLIQPDANNSDKLKENYWKVFDSVAGLEENAISYDASVSKLKQFISQSELDVATKQNLISLANPPEGFYTIGSWSLQSADLRQGIDSFYSQANVNISSWLDNLQSRIKMNNSWILLYGEDKDLLEKTGNNFSSLKQAYDYIFSEQYRDFWKRQDRLQELNSNWSKAVNNYNSGAFDSVSGFALKAKQDVVAIYSDGLVQSGNDFTFIAIEVVIALIIIWLIISLMRRRKNSMDLNDDGYGSEEDNY